MYAPMRRAPAAATYERVPHEEVAPLVSRLVDHHDGSHARTAETLSRIGGGTVTAWKQTIHRITTGRYDRVQPATDEAIRLALGLEPRPPAYRQRVWRVTGRDPWHRQQRDGSPRTWFYVRESDARKRKEMLEQRGLFVEWAVADATWRELKTGV